MRKARFQIRISVVRRKWAYCFYGRENGVFWAAVKIEKCLFPISSLEKGQLFRLEPGWTIGKQIDNGVKL